MAFATDIAAKIVSAGLGTAISTDIFLGAKANIPSKPENVGPYISLIDTGGTGALRTHSTRYPRPSLQIVVRAAAGPIAKAKAELILLALTDLRNVTLEGTFYLRLEAVQEVTEMQADEAGRARFGFNINCLKTQ